MSQSLIRSLKAFCLVVVAILPLSAQDKSIDTERSTITVHVGRSGMLSFAGHEHWVSAPISNGVIGEGTTPHVEFTVDAAKMEIKPDPKVDEKTRRQIQHDMQEKVLQSARYAEIRFRSSRAVAQSDGSWTVEGKLTICGVSRPIIARVRRDAGAYVSHLTIKQTDFGITLISAAGGTVKVRNDLDIDFRIMTR